MNIYKIIRNGLKATPDKAWTFRYFILSREEWEKKLDSVYSYADTCFEMYYPTWRTGGNVGPCGTVSVQEWGNFVFVYSVDGCGDHIPEAFTHKVIAGM